jgi:hypothetical protein
MGRRQIIVLAIVVILIAVLKFANDFQGAKSKVSVKSKTTISKNKGDVMGISEKLDSGLRYVEKQAGNIIQTTTNYVIEQASNSANTLTNEVIKNTTQNILNQIEKLPQSQQNAVKEVICK